MWKAYLRYVLNGLLAGRSTNPANSNAEDRSWVQSNVGLTMRVSGWRSTDLLCHGMRGLLGRFILFGVALTECIGWEVSKRVSLGWFVGKCHSPWHENNGIFLKKLYQAGWENLSQAMVRDWKGSITPSSNRYIKVFCSHCHFSWDLPNYHELHHRFWWIPEMRWPLAEEFTRISCTLRVFQPARWLPGCRHKKKLFLLVR